MELVPPTGTERENIAGVGTVGRPFEMRQSDDLDGAARLTLLGGLDIVVADRLTARLRKLLATGHVVRVDVSELGFIDCTGLRTLVHECERARGLQQSLEVDRPVSAPVKRVITFLDVASLLWPPSPQPELAALRLISDDPGGPKRQAHCAGESPYPAGESPYQAGESPETPAKADTAAPVSTTQVPTKVPLRTLSHSHSDEQH